MENVAKKLWLILCALTEYERYQVFGVGECRPFLLPCPVEGAGDFVHRVYPDPGRVENRQTQDSHQVAGATLGVPPHVVADHHQHQEEAGQEEEGETQLPVERLCLQLPLCVRNI